MTNYTFSNMLYDYVYEGQHETTDKEQT